MFSLSSKKKQSRSFIGENLGNLYAQSQSSPEKEDTAFTNVVKLVSDSFANLLSGGLKEPPNHRPV